jgi:hypothetical protein
MLWFACLCPLSLFNSYFENSTAKPMVFEGGVFEE